MHAGKLALFILFGTAFSFQSNAQVNCDAVLAKTTIADNSKTNIALAALDLVTQDNFEEFKKQFAGSGSFPIKGIPVGASSKYNDFEQKRAQHKEEHRFDYKFSQIRNLSISYLNPAAIDAWVKCVEADRTEILVLRPTFVSATEITLQARWKPGSSLVPGRPGKEIVSGGKLKSDMPKEFLYQWTPLQFERHKGEPFSLDLTMLNGNAPHIDLPAYSPIYNAPLSCLSATEKGCLSCLFVSDDIKPSLTNFGSGSKAAFKCENMVPSKTGFANIQLVYKVLGATSGRTRIHWHAKVGQVLYKSVQDFVSSRIPSPPTIDSQSILLESIKTSDSGNVFVQIGLDGCYWTDNGGSVDGGGCSISAHDGVKIRVDIE